jgi:hypothetical protein
MTQIFKSYSEFLQRPDKDVNGASQTFADDQPQYVEQNETNKGCWNCSDCSDCSRCSDCSGCSRCSRCSDCSHIAWLSGKKNIAVDGTPGDNIMGKYPVVENIHQKVYEAASAPQALNMTLWHSCDTTHCRAGWVVHLAGERGYELERITGPVFAAMQIYKASSPDINVSPVRFFEDNKTALDNMKECAEREAQLSV